MLTYTKTKKYKLYECFKWILYMCKENIVSQAAGWGTVQDDL